MSKKKKIITPNPERAAKNASIKARSSELSISSRVFEGYVSEPELVSMSDLLTCANSEIKTKNGKDIQLVTVLPGAITAQIIETDPGKLVKQVALQSNTSLTPQSLANAIDWLEKTETVSQLGSPEEKDLKLSDYIDPKTKISVEIKNDFNWWFGSQDLDPQIKQAVDQANSMIQPAKNLFTGKDEVFWLANYSDRTEQIRWVKSIPEDELIIALARVYAKGNIANDDLKFMGTARTKGLAVIVYEVLNNNDKIAEKLKSVSKEITDALKVNTELSTEERKARDSLRARQITL